jgi:release factor glutamine methyltransferase
MPPALVRDHERMRFASHRFDKASVAAALRSAGCVFADDEAKLLMSAASDQADLAEMVGRRISGQPIEHVVGWAEFCGLRIAVDQGVFVPRRRTEFLVRQAIAIMRAAEPRGGAGQSVIVDLCCGSGAVAAALTAALPWSQVHAADIDPAAVSCARRNLAAAGGSVYQGDLYDALPDGLRGRVSMLTANAPYVPAAAIGLLPAEARRHEPRAALDGGPDGLGVVRRVIAGAGRWLRPGGQLLIETSERQVAQALAAAAGCGLTAAAATCDDLDAIVIIATPTAA